MSTIWITGGKGFIGRHIARHIASEGHRVYGIGHGEWPRNDASTWCYTSWYAGEIDATTLDRLAGMSGPPDTIYHLAGGSSVAASLQNPYEDFARTVDVTARLLEWMRLHAAGVRLVAVSSAAVYGASHRDAIPEASPLSPCSPYGVHMAMKESLCRSYGRTFGLQLALVRLFSVYGPGLKKQLIWDLCCKLDAADRVPGPVMLGGSGLEVRDWLHVTDAVRLLWLARKECGPDCPVVNGGTGVGTKVREVADCVARAWGVPPTVSFNGAIRSGDPPTLVADISGAARLGFRPSIALEPGIIETVAWFKNAGGARSSA